jgi:hypothetical protein
MCSPDQRKRSVACVSILALASFKTGEGRYPVLAGSIPVRLRRPLLAWRLVVRNWPRPVLDDPVGDVRVLQRFLLATVLL